MLSRDDILSTGLGYCRSKYLSEVERTEEKVSIKFLGMGKSWVLRTYESMSFKTQSRVIKQDKVYRRRRDCLLSRIRLPVNVQKVHGWLPQSNMWAFAAGDTVISFDLRPTESAFSREKIESKSL